jgi:uncharacterized UPF0146 family protein
VPGSSPQLTAVLGAFDRVVEVGIGRRTDVARQLARRGVQVTATDVVERSVPAGVEFVRDDLTQPTRAVYASADAIYALRLPPELQRPAAALAASVGVPLFFTTLGGDPTVIEATQRSTAAGPLFVRRPEDGTPR